MSKNVFIAFVLMTVFISACSDSEKTPSKPVIAVSIRPLADFVHRVGGEFVEIITIIPDGSNPHTFELSPVLMKKIVDSDLLVLNGLGLEYWGDKIRENLDETAVLVTTQHMPDLLEMHHGHSTHAHHYNPHVWLDPLFAIYQVKQIRDALSRIDSAHQEQYDLNAEQLVAEISELDQWIQKQVSTWSRHRFICFHPAWSYFAERYDLVMAGVIEKRPGAEPTPGDIKDIINQIREIGARAVFTEAQFPSKTADMIAAESHVAVIALDPLGATGLTTYVDLMKYNVRQMAQGMK